MALTVTIDGVDRSSYVRLTSIDVGMDYRAPWTATFILKDLLSTSSAYRPALNDAVVIADGAVVFCGWVFAIDDEPIGGTADGTQVRVRCKAYDALLDAIVVDETYGGDRIIIANSSIANPTSITTTQPHGYTTGDEVIIEEHVGGVAGVNGTHVVTVTSHLNFTVPINNTTSGGGGTVRKVVRADDIVTDLHTNYLNARGVTLDTLSTGALLERQNFDGVSLREVFNHLSEITGWVIRITPAPQLQFFSPGTKTVSYSLTAANNKGVGPVRWGQERTRYVNAVLLRYGTESIVPKTDVFTGDGATNSYALRYTPRKDVHEFVISAGVVVEAGAHVPLDTLADITSSSVANPSVITTRVPHNHPDGASVIIQGHAGSTPDINGTHTATIIDAYRFSIPVNVTVAGSGGSTYNPARTWLWYSPTNTLFRVGNLASETVATFTYEAQFPQTVTVADAGEVAANGEWPGIFEWPNTFEKSDAEAIAAGILRRELATPKKVEVETRLNRTDPTTDRFIMPGDAITLTYSDRTISGTHIAQSVRAKSEADRNLHYFITAVDGNEFRESPTNIMRDVASRGGVRPSGGTITGAAIPGNTVPSLQGIFPHEVIAHHGRGGDYTGADGWQFESSLDYYLDSSTLGPAVVLGMRDQTYAWAITADTLAGATPGSTPRLKFTPVAEGPTGTAAMVLMGHLTYDGATYFLLPGPGANTLAVGDRLGATTAGTPVPLTDVFADRVSVGTGYLEQLNSATMLRGAEQSIANAGVVTIGDNAPSGSTGFLFVEDVTNALYAVFYLRGGANAVSTVAASAGWSTTAGTGSSRNVYWSGGNSRYELQNNSGGTATFRLTVLGLLN